MNPLVRFNNWRSRRKAGRFRPEHVLVLLPNCLQKSTCQVNLRQDVMQCRRCGQCPVAEIVEMCDRLGVKAFLATGGRQAAARVKSPDVHAVVAVACSKELTAGVLVTFPKPVIAIENTRPNGPCIDTLVGTEEVRQAVEQLLETH